MFFVGNRYDSNAEQPLLLPRDQSKPKITLNESTPFRIASVTKTFTGTLVSINSRLHSDNQTVKDLRTYDDNMWTARQFAPILVRNLINYWSGLPSDNTNPTDEPHGIQRSNYSLGQMRSYLNEVASNVLSPDLQNGTGRKYTYWNLAFAMLSLVWPAYFNTTVEADIKRFMMDPLGAQVTPLFITESTDLGGFPLGYRYSTKEPITKKMQYFWLVAVSSG
jgi:CubicO group peptidase (beta-lactamase class C family)